MNLLPGANLATLFQALLGEEPKAYDWRTDPRARPNPAERENLSVHVDQCTIRQIEIKQMFAKMRIERYSDRKLLLTIVAILLVDAAGAREVLTAILP
jgi:hypothetical protein